MKLDLLQFMVDIVIHCDSTIVCKIGFLESNTKIYIKGGFIV